MWQLLPAHRYVLFHYDWTYTRQEMCDNCFQCVEMRLVNVIFGSATGRNA